MKTNLMGAGATTIHLSAPAGRHVYSTDWKVRKAPSGATCERNMPPRWGFWAVAVAGYKRGAPNGALRCLSLSARKFLNSSAAPQQGDGCELVKIGPRLRGATKWWRQSWLLLA